MKIENDKVVLIHYTLRNDNNDVLDSSIGLDPFSYIHGAGDIIIGLEKALHGKQKGDKFLVEVSPEDGYGVYLEELVYESKKDDFSEIEDLKEGIQVELMIETDQGSQPAMGTILEIGDDLVKFDVNHPLAGKTLYFDIEVINVRDKTLEEWDVGRIISPAGD